MEQNADKTRLDMNCLLCNLRQAIHLSERLGMPTDSREDMMREVLLHLGAADYGLSNPEIFGGTWEIITRHSGQPDPYRATMDQYNRELLALLPVVEEMIASSADPFKTALKAAIAGNLIDFAVHHELSAEMLVKKITELAQTPFGVDHADRLYHQLSQAQTLVYLGDNCGEIVLDKLFIMKLREWFPNLAVRFVVRGQAVLNDVTLTDAAQVGMAEVALVLANGDRSPGTVLTRVSEEVRLAGMQADVVIAKGQGNFESLYGCPRPGLFHLFMVKCAPIAALLGMNLHAVMCMENTPLHVKENASLRA